MTRKINLGCGHKKLDGYINVDFNPSCHPDVLHNLQKGLPFDSNTADEIVAYDFLEHCEDFVSTMNEIIRVLKIGGVLKARFPPWNSEGAFSVAHPRVLIYRDFVELSKSYATDFVYSVNGEKLQKRWKVLTTKTVKGKCPYCPEGNHKIDKCHVIMKRIK